MLDRIADGRRDGSGHGVEEEQQGLFRALASEWLDRVEAWTASGRVAGAG